MKKLTGILLLTSLLIITLTATAAASSGIVWYDFDSLNGSDVYPYTDLNGQDNWSSQGFVFADENPGLIMGVTESTGFDGSQSLRFDTSGAGHIVDASRLNDGSFSTPALDGSETAAFLQVDFKIGYWGETIALAHDTNGDGLIRHIGPDAVPGEIGPQLRIGTDGSTQLQLISASGQSTLVPLASIGLAGIPFGTEWVRLRLEMDFTANGGQGAGYVYYQNLSNGDSELQPAPGLQGISLDLDANALNAGNPTLWDAMWVNMDSGGNELDNVVISDGQKDLVCHKNGKTLSVGAKSVSAHLAHGDSQGPCS